MSSALEVRHGADPVGRLWADDAGRFCFEYASSWLERADAFPLSLAVPLRTDPFLDGAAHAFFGNLLPEGQVRQAVCRRLGISEANDLALLRAIGEDCAGALSVTEPDAPPADTTRFAYEELDEARLRELAAGEDVVPLLVGGPEVRLSLAGAQDKLPVAVRGGRICLPRGHAPSTHILKLPNPRYPHLPANEVFVTGLAARIGLGVISAELLATDPPLLLSERFDRRRAADERAPATRVHQEDLCQALGLPSSAKYEKEGGPGLIDAIELVRAHVSEPLIDVRRLLEWQAFNVVVGNCDGHGKNLSLLHTGPGRLVVAPFYDLLSTRYYPGVSRTLAMTVGGRGDPEELHASHWKTLASEAGIGPRLLLDVIAGVIGRCGEDIDGWSREFRERHGELPILERLPKEIARRSRKLGRRLR